MAKDTSDHLHDAAMLGLHLFARDFNVEVKTANGITRVAKVDLGLVEIDGLLVRSVAALVPPPRHAPRTFSASRSCRGWAALRGAKARWCWSGRHLFGAASLGYLLGATARAERSDVPQAETCAHPEQLRL